MTDTAKEGETSIPLKEIVKKPMDTLFKVANNLIAGGGAASQELINTAAIEKFGNPEVINGIELITAQILAGTIKQGQISAFFNGFGIGAAKDLTKSLISFIRGKAKVAPPKPPIIPNGVPSAPKEVVDFG